ncbi:hypothetical protein G7Y89_g9661 [Cudoniella acicularis]|uniref:Carbohydrate kinase PfkB domain-containing protein n=1 Tax=Cudoniella acicularis TaxID=354080 RepID=A0A8H4RE85_9HELO|nr:hypothetical protein G7Y89_g9661 [Cudoniella acicularis]
MRCLREAKEAKLGLWMDVVGTGWVAAVVFRERRNDKLSVGAQERAPRMEEEKEAVCLQQEIDFCTLGMFIIGPLSKTVSWIVDQGSDFPPSISDQISSWDTSCLIRTNLSRLTTRGWNGYDEAQNRAFKYTTPKLRLDESALTENLLFSKSFHLICSPSRCISLTTSILRHRKHLNPSAPKPLFIWEPVPDLCTPSELLNTTNALPYIDICSPNHHELASLMGDPALGLDPVTNDIDTSSIERACEQLLGSMPLQSYTLVIRAGHKGCYVAKNGGRSRRPSVARKKRRVNHARGGLTPDTDMEALFMGLLSKDGFFELEREAVQVDPGIGEWLPAFHSSSQEKEEEVARESVVETEPHLAAVELESPDQESEPPENMDATPSPISATTKNKVIDPTGGGNAFLGGLAIALSRGKEILEAAAWGSVAASFAIEQVGIPVLKIDDLGEETWNGVTVEERLGRFVELWKGGGSAKVG